MYEPISREAEAAAKETIDAALAVHRALGPGLIEPVYEVCLCYELSQHVPLLKDGIKRIVL